MCWTSLPGKCQDQASGEGHAREDLSRMPLSGCGRAVSVSIKETVGSCPRMHRACAPEVVRVRQHVPTKGKALGGGIPCWFLE